MVVFEFRWGRVYPVSAMAALADHGMDLTISKKLIEAIMAQEPGQALRIPGDLLAGKDGQAITAAARELRGLGIFVKIRAVKDPHTNTERSLQAKPMPEPGILPLPL